MKKRTPYITGAELKHEIWLSKLSYCYSLEAWPESVIQCSFDFSGHELPVDMTGYVRHFTTEHVPASNRRVSGKARHPGLEWTNFEPFKIYHDGQEIIRSHWQGGFANGSFSTVSGKLTPKLATYIIKLTDKLATKSNFSGYSYKDEMIGAARIQLVRGILLFDDAKSNNAFAYATQIATNGFKRVLSDEKTVRDTRDKLLISYGFDPSHSYEGDHRLNIE